MHDQPPSGRIPLIRELMELRHIRYFCAVAEARSFSRAAERLLIAQSPLSQQIRKLERELGVELFARNTRSVSLTHAGSVFYDNVRHLLSESERAVEATLQAVRGERGRIAVGLTGFATCELLPALISAHRERTPDVALDLHGDMTTPDQISALVDERLTVGIVRPPARAEGLIVELVRHEPVGLLMPAAHPSASSTGVDLSTLRREDFVGYPSTPESSMYVLTMEACRKAGFVPEIRQEAREIVTVAALVAGGVGVAVVPASARRLTMDGVTYCPLANPVIETSLALAYRADVTSPLVRRFLETARSVFRRAANPDCPTNAPLDERNEFFGLSL